MVFFFSPFLLIKRINVVLLFKYFFFSFPHQHSLFKLVLVKISLLEHVNGLFFPPLIGHLSTLLFYEDVSPDLYS